jgi:hypothetical protein
MHADSLLSLQFCCCCCCWGGVDDRFYCDVPDEFLFSAHCNLHELAIAVHDGALTTEQMKRFGVGADTDGAAAAGNGTRGTAEAVGGTAGGAGYRQPFCPWFTCCY